MYPDKNIPESFCTAPWAATYVDPTGDVRPCCIYRGSVGNINENSFDEILNSDKMKELKKELIKGEKPEECSICWEQEKISPGTSFQKTMKRRFYNSIPNMINETYDTLLYWDLRPSNSCNFGCLMCCNDLSSGHWQLNTDLNRPNVLEQKFVEVNKNGFDDVIDKMKSVLSNITEEEKEQYFHIYFAGGEPLLLEHHRNMLMWLIESGNDNIKIRYNTNCSTIKYKGTDFIEIWKNWKVPIEIDASIDSSGIVGEYQRYGSSWKSIKNNLIKLADCDNIDLTYNIVVSFITYNNLVETINELEKINGTSLKDKVRFNHVNSNRFDIRMIPKEKLNIDILNRLDKRGYDVKQLYDVINSYDSFLYNKKSVWNELISLFDDLKRVKNKDIYSMLPWIQDIKDSI